MPAKEPHQESHREPDSRELLDQEVKRQRGGIYLMALLLIAAIVVFTLNPSLADVFQSATEKDKQESKSASKTGSDPDKDTPANKGDANPAPGDGEPQGKIGGQDGEWPNLAGIQVKKHAKLQANVATTESVAIVSYPWRVYRGVGELSGGYGDRAPLLELAKARGLEAKDYLALKWGWEMPAEKAWLPELSFDLAYNICDNNDRLEAAYLNDVENILPRIGPELTWQSVAAVAAALSVEHIIVVNFAVEQKFGEREIVNVGGKGWQLWQWSNGSPTTGRGLPDVTLWPKENALLGLRTDLAQHLRPIAGQPINLGTMPESDSYGSKLAAMRNAMNDARFDDAGVVFNEIQKAYPDDEASIYALYHGTREITRRYWSDADDKVRAKVHEHSVKAMNGYVRAGGKSYRLRTLVAANFAYDTSEQWRKEREIFAFNMLYEVLHENSLFHEALNQLHKIADYDEKGEPIEWGFFERIKEAQKLHPNDARYYLKEAQTRAVDPASADEAIRLANRAIEIEPWLRSGYYIRGLANLIKADAMRRVQPLDRSACEDLYLKSYRSFYEGWQRNPSEIKHWAILMDRALAYGRASKEVSFSKDLNHPVVPTTDLSHLMPLYLNARIYATLFQDDEVSYARQTLASVFGGEREAWFDAYLSREVVRVLARKPQKVANDAAFGPVHEELILLAGVMQRVGTWTVNPSDENRAAVLEVLRVYRERGARCPELEGIIGPLLGK